MAADSQSPNFESGYKPIGEILVEKGFITPEQLEHALEQQRDTPDDKIGEILVRLGYVTLKDVTSAYAEQVLMRYGTGDDDTDLPLE